MKKTITIALLVRSVVAQVTFHKTPICAENYTDGTLGHAYHWGCAENCTGGRHWADKCCLCACVLPGTPLNPLVQKVDVDCTQALAWRPPVPTPPPTPAPVPIPVDGGSVSISYAISPSPSNIQGSNAGTSDSEEDEGGIPIGVKIVIGVISVGGGIVLFCAIAVACGRSCRCCKGRSSPNGEEDNPQKLTRKLSQVQPEPEENPNPTLMVGGLVTSNADGKDTMAEEPLRRASLASSASSKQDSIASFQPRYSLQSKDSSQPKDSFQPKEAIVQEAVRRASLVSFDSLTSFQQQKEEKVIAQDPLKRAAVLAEGGFPPPPPRVSKKNSVKSTPAGLAHHTWKGDRALVIGCKDYVEEGRRSSSIRQSVKSTA